MTMSRKVEVEVVTFVELLLKTIRFPEIPGMSSKRYIMRPFPSSISVLVVSSILGSSVRIS